MKPLRIKETHGFTVKQLRLMEKQAKDLFTAKRLSAVRMVMEGNKAIEVAAILNIHRDSVSKYVKLFEEGGVKHLLERKVAPGKESYLSESEKSQLRETILTQTPREVGIGMESHWNTKIIQHLIWEQFNVWMTREGIRVMLHRMGLRYTRSTYTLAKADHEKQEQFEQQLTLIKKTPNRRWCTSV